MKKNTKIFILEIFNWIKFRFTCPTIITNRKTEFSSNTLRSERVEDNQTFIPEPEIVHHSKLIKGQVDESYVEIFVSTERDIPFNFDNI